MPRLERILRYPIKALDAFESPNAALNSGGALEWDRRFALVDAAGHFLNGKRCEKIHTLRSVFDPESQTLTVWSAHLSRREFLLEHPEATEKFARFMTEFLGQPVRLEVNLTHGLPDDTEVCGPTVISVATLETVAGWFPGLSTENIRRRFRANLEIGGVEPFWEDRLFGAYGRTVEFRIGAVQFHGVNPCQRCIVPTRDPETAARYPDFQKIFQVKRQQHLPAWAATERFNHFYRLAVNSRIAAGQAGEKLYVGDEVRLA